VDGGTRLFIGRRFELERVRRAIETRARFVVLEGDAGMGKTRLLRESLSLLPTDVPRYEATAERYDARLLGPIRDAFALEVGGWERLPEGMRKHRPAIDALFPDGGGRRNADEASLPTHVLADSILAIVQHAVGGQHGVLVIDDVQWADSDVLAVINRLVRSRLPCTTVIATRPLDHETDYLVQFLTDLRGSVETEHLELAPLSLDEVSDLLRRTVGLAATSFAADVHERTGGHPFLIRQLLDTGQLSSSADAFDLPRTVTESTRRSLIRLSDDARATVEAAATLGRTAGFHELARFTEFDEPRLVAAVQELCDERLLTEPSADDFAFAHVLAQQAVTESIVSRQRRRLHGRALDILPPDTDPLDVVRHAEQAGTPERGLDAVRTAAKQALNAGHMGRAYRLAAAGAALVPHDLDLTEIHALSAWYTGRHTEACRVALAALPSLGAEGVQRRVQMEWLVARSALNSGAMDIYEAAVQRLIDLAGTTMGDDRALLLARIAELTMLTDRVDALEWAEEAYACAAPDTEAQVVARINLGSVLTDVPGRRHEGRQQLRSAVELARTLGSDHTRARALNNLLSEIVYVDEARDVLALLDEFENHLLASGLAPNIGDNAVLWRGVVAERQGDLAAARAAVSWYGPAAPERTSCLVWFNALLELSVGDLGACKRALDREPPARPDYHTRFLMVDLERAVRCGARPLGGAVVELFESLAPKPRYMLDHLDQVGHAATQLARLAADRDVATCRDIAHRWRALMMHDPDADSIQRHLDAIAAEAEGDPSEAIELYERSLTGLPRRAATITADAHQGLAHCWDARGDRRAARAWASSAVALLDRWPGPDRDAATRLLRRLGGRPPRVDATSALSDREREVAELVGRGLTNKEIGANLFISDRTVGVHIQHIMNKLDLGKRAEIAAYVARSGAG
jgi:DNA-binding CsgD family transcriptional regulator